MRRFQSSRLQMQFFKFVVIGGVANSFGYGAYLLITWLGVGSILGMSVVYLSTCLVSFLGNKNWSFAVKRGNRLLFPRYLFVYLLGYITNLIVLTVLSQRLEMPHQFAQLFAGVFVAIELFWMNKSYVFTSN